MSNRILRAKWHDYQSRCIYMVTLSKAPGVKDFGILTGDVRIPPGQRGAPFVSTSGIGAAIKQAIRDFPKLEDGVRVLQYAIMPDHLHLLIFVEEQTEVALGTIIARFKTSVNRLLGTDHVFDKGFNDQILKPGRKLDTLFEYLRANPYRLAIRRAHSDYFRRVNTLIIGDNTFQAYGNFQLLDNPFKEQVVVHRADTPEIRERNRQNWLYTAANGGVLVSPFISEAEKAIRSEAEDAGGRLIHLTVEPFGERFKPAAHDFALCEEGRLLILSTALPDAKPMPLTRSQCLHLNALAADLAKTPGRET